MPLYPFISILDETKSKDIFYLMKEAPTIGAIVKDEEGEWKRVFATPSKPIFVENVNPNSALAFEKSCEGKNYTNGDVWTKSAEMSEKRAAANGGVDPVKKIYYDDYARRNGGARHHGELREKSAKMGITYRIPKPV